MGSLWNRSGTVERYSDDLRAAGAKAFFFQGGTTTPMTVFRDATEGSPFPNPVVADANGRWPDVFVPFAVSYDVQTKTANDVQLTYTQLIPNPNPVDITTTVPPDSIVQTGMIHAELTTNQVRAGYVRLNGNTIGNATSGASERANADCSALFIFLYNQIPDALAPVSGGRTGAGAAGDFALSKTIRLPDTRGRALMGADEMGAASIGVYPAGITFDAGGGSATSGSTTGINLLTLSLAQMPSHVHGGSTSSDGAHTHTVDSPPGLLTGIEGSTHTHTQQGTFGTTDANLNHTHDYTDFFYNQGANNTAAGAFPPGGTAASTTRTTFDASINLDHTHSVTISGNTLGQNSNHQHSITFNIITNDPGNHSHTFAMTAAGSSAPFNNMPLSMLVNWYIKL
jgi:microcystin-dependent protein